MAKKKITELVEETSGGLPKGKRTGALSRANL